MAQHRNFRGGAGLFRVLVGIASVPLVPVAGHAEDALAPWAAHGADAAREAELAPAPGGGAHEPREREPIRSYTDEQGRACRVYERSVVIDGTTRTALATVCRDATGRWVLSR